MTSWAERMHRRAATFSNVVTSCGQPNVYPRRLDKVKFGAPLDEVCKNDIPAPLLVLILKLNKEAPVKKDVFRAPGHQGNMKKLVHFLQAGRLVNMDKYSVYTIASVLKKFLRKIPGGIFGRANEQHLFTIVQMESVEQQRNEIHQHLARLMYLEDVPTGMPTNPHGMPTNPHGMQPTPMVCQLTPLNMPTNPVEYANYPPVVHQLIPQSILCQLTP
ncbi:unnamed protein product [Nesidiocoris tenuis]|uniref:Rho-GAP domain-containing protein n=1 Tax=Nesidiocoris tenuis TaxID=355587 RepID=A0A6H5GHB5_9HEMI|nr:unnamed protein product [Nesidiocoris tenuis]CAB0002940.1 unnamed protein product [Nesidiocoris tenuis]